MLSDCLNGLLSLAAAREQYGVSIQHGQVDETETARLKK